MSSLSWSDSWQKFETCVSNTSSIPQNRTLKQVRSMTHVSKLKDTSSEIRPFLFSKGYKYKKSTFLQSHCMPVFNQTQKSILNWICGSEQKKNYTANINGYKTNLNSAHRLLKGPLTQCDSSSLQHNDE